MRYNHLTPVPPLTKVTKVLIIICAVMYVVDFMLTKLGIYFGGLELSRIFGLVPIFTVEKFWLWQPITYIFLHGSPLHILLNMLILWYFGSELEMRLGQKEFLKYFFLCGVGAGLFNLWVNYAFSDPARLSGPIIGASGAIYGILAAYGIFFGERYFLVFFLFPMKAKYFVLLMAAIELFMGAEARPEDNVAHFAHLGGMIVGAAYLFARYLRPKGKGPRKSKRDHERERLKKQFTLIVNPEEEQDQPEKPEENPRGPYWN